MIEIIKTYNGFCMASSPRSYIKTCHATNEIIEIEYLLGFTMTRLYELEMYSITGELIPFSNFRDQALLIVNLASLCGLTTQYEGLCKLHKQGVVKVLGFPCNQFGNQEPGTDEDILKFAKSRYDSNFPIFSKVEVNGENTCELYQWLKSEKADAEGNSDISWNFTKFLVSEDGEVLARFAPGITPDDISTKLEDYL